VFERGSRKTPEVDDDQVKVLDGQIGELAIANEFLARKLKPWTGKWGSNAAECRMTP